MGETVKIKYSSPPKINYFNEKRKILFLKDRDEGRLHGALFVFS